MQEIKIVGYIFIIAIIVSVLLVPMTEAFNVGRERILLGSTIYNSCRAARDIGYEYVDMRRLDSVAAQENFKYYFADTFATSYGMTCADPLAAPLHFTATDEAYNDFYVEMSFNTVHNIYEGYATTTVTVTAESDYNFKTKYLQMIVNRDGIPFQLRSSRDFIMQVVN